MMNGNRTILKHMAKLYDLAMIVASFVLATFLLNTPGNAMSLKEFMAMRITLGNVLLFGILLLCWHNLFILCGLYDSKRLTPRSSEILGVCKASILAALILLLAAQLLHIQMVSSRFVTTMWVICTSAMIAGRLVAGSILLVLRRRGRNSRFMLIVGTNERAIEFARRIGTHPELGYKIVGFVDDEWEGTAFFEATGHTRCCSFAGLAEFLRHNVVDEAAIYLPLRSFYEHSAELVTLCEHHGIVIRTDPRIFRLRSHDSTLVDLDEGPEMITAGGPASVLPGIVKRAIDCVVSAVLLLLLAPLFAVVSLLVKFSCEGPVFFRQTRVGLNKRLFTMYKFRTMIADAEKVQDKLLAMNEMSGPVFKMKDDPRITPLGKFLRKTSIDELPQLFNVLMGEMSLVGPRAMSLRDYQLFDKDVHRRRFSVKPGITCLWQVNGRSSIPFEQWMELDLQYIDKWSLWLDLKILAQTVPAVWRGTGAA